MESCWICVKVGYWNLILHVIVVCSVLSVNTGTEPKVPIPNFLGTEFLQEPIGTDLLRNRICMGTEEPNRSVPVRYYRIPRVTFLPARRRAQSAGEACIHGSSIRSPLVREVPRGALRLPSFFFLSFTPARPHMAQLLPGHAPSFTFSIEQLLVAVMFDTPSSARSSSALISVDGTTHV